MTDPTTATPPTSQAEPDAQTSLPPDPVAYDDPRNVHARARGLPAPYITGGRDPNPAEGLREERYYGRLLVLMVVAIILAGFVLGLLVAIAVNM